MYGIERVASPLISTHKTYVGWTMRTETDCPRRALFFDVERKQPKPEPPARPKITGDARLYRPVAVQFGEYVDDAEQAEYIVGKQRHLLSDKPRVAGKCFDCDTVIAKKFIRCVPCAREHSLVVKRQASKRKVQMRAEARELRFCKICTAPIPKEYMSSRTTCSDKCSLMNKRAAENAWKKENRGKKK